MNLYFPFQSLDPFRCYTLGLQYLGNMKMKFKYNFKLTAVILKEQPYAAPLSSAAVTFKHLL